MRYNYRAGLSALLNFFNSFFTTAFSEKLVEEAGIKPATSPQICCCTTL